MTWTKAERGFMARAEALAARGRYGAHPNPMVGAVIVKDGRVIGEGAHLRWGGPHAEVNALRGCRSQARGAALYVTLEPCSTYGKTPPCTEALIKAGIREVFIGAADPNPANAGRAARVLRRAGIKVRSGLLRRECEGLNPAFNKYMRTGLPYVTLKLAQSVDGRIADAAGRSKWISSPQARLEAHRLRAEADAVLAGIGTVLADDPRLDVRGVRVRRQPVTVVLDSRLRLPRRARLLANERVLIASTRRPPAGRPYGPRAEVLTLPSEGGHVPLPALLRALGGMGVSHVLVEGGGEVAGAFLSRGLVDRFVCFVAPLVIGGTASKSSVVWPDALNAVRRRLGIKARLHSVGHAGPDLALDLRF